MECFEDFGIKMVIRVVLKIVSLIYFMVSERHFIKISLDIMLYFHNLLYVF